MSGHKPRADTSHERTQATIPSRVLFVVLVQLERHGLAL